DGSYTLSLAVNDGTNPAVTSNATVNVSDVAPKISITSPAMDQLFATTTSGGTAPVSIVAPFTDAGTADTHTCSIQWDTPLTTTTYAATETGPGTGNCNTSSALSPGVYLAT